MAETPKNTIKNIPNERTQFEQWANKVDSINSQDTINTYWKQVKKIPKFSLKEDSAKEIVGLIDRNIQSEHQLLAVKRYIDFKMHLLREDETISNEKYTDLKFKKNSIVSNLELDEAAVKKKHSKIKRHYINKQDLVEMLRRSPPKRARYWATTYLLGVRWFASKTLTDKHFYRQRGEHGVVRIPAERTKSKDTRDVQLYSDWFWKLIEEAPQGNWEDRHGRTWKNVYFPEVKQSKENYELGQKKNGKVYGLIGDLGMSPRTIHSFRHTRITDLLKAEGKPIKEVQDRAGHGETKSTNHYSEVSFNREPLSLEQYCRENNVDLVEVVESRP